MHGLDIDSKERFVEVCDLETMDWRQQQTYGPSCPVFGKGASSAVIGDHLYIFGGLDDEDYRNELFRLHLEDFTWQQLSKKDSPSERSYGGMVTHGECLLVFGGLGKKPHAPSLKGAQTIRDDKFGGEFISEWNNSMHEYNTVTGKCSLYCWTITKSEPSFLWLVQTVGGKLAALAPGLLLWRDSPLTK